MNQLYTSSRLRVWRECQRKAYFRYALGITTPSTPQMQFGTATHKALEAWYLAWKANEDRLAAANAAIDESGMSDVDQIRLRVLVTAYHARWGRERWEVLGVEVQFRYFLGNIEIGGKIDALIREIDTGKVFVVEHKTSSADTSPGSGYWDRLCIDTQVSIYIDGVSFGLNYEVSGCIYDVLKRPQHEPLLATPEDKRKYTVGKGCKGCGGSAKAGEIKQGNGFYTAAFGTDIKKIDCADCKGTGWKCDAKTGEPEAPRLHATQRAEDESLEQFEERLVNEISERVDEFLVRSVVVRLDDELPRMRQELIDTITAMEKLDELDIHPPNHDACIKFREMCPFFQACAGRADISDEHEFPRGGAHPELAEQSAAEAA